MPRSGDRIPGMYPPEIRDTIVDLLASESLLSICQREGMPDRLTITRWMREDESFATKCARAREEHADLIFEGLADIERDLLDVKVKADAARVVISSRQWRLEKIKPKKYGPKLETTHEAGDSLIRAVVREIVKPSA